MKTLAPFTWRNITATLHAPMIIILEFELNSSHLSSLICRSRNFKMMDSSKFSIEFQEAGMKERA